MEHVLDNMIWNAITTGNTSIADQKGNAGVYKENIAPFAAVKEWNEINVNQLHSLIPPGRRIAMSYPDNFQLDADQWLILQQMDCYQMVYENPVEHFTTPASALITRLDETHIPQMLELTALTKPGPFFEKTILFGNYFGIFQNGRLAAMAGQRMHPVPYMEVSAVCTHPDFRGSGYAKAIMLHVMKIIIDNSFIPFLHVLADNNSAIRLYKSIGFVKRKRLYISGIKRI